MARGKYERTELVTARIRLAKNETRIQKLHGLLAEAEHKRLELQEEINELEKAETK